MAYDFQTQFNSPNFTSAADAVRVFGMPRLIEGFTVHWWGDPSTNPSYEGIVNYLCRANGNTSAHIVTSGTGRRAACIVDFSNIAWHAGSAWGNARTIGIELDPRGREEDKDVFAEVLADLRSAFGDLPLYWHSYFTSTTCPGVYRALVDDLDQRSYKKISGAQWGQVTNKDLTPTPTPNPVPPPANTPTTTPQDVAFRVYGEDGKQIGAYNVEANAYKKFVDATSGKGKIMQGSKNVTETLVAKYTTPSPTTQDPQGNPLPDTGKPVTEKQDWEDIKNQNNAILTLLQKIWALLTSVFKGGN